jgi:hypothetical protein
MYTTNSRIFLDGIIKTRSSTDRKIKNDVREFEDGIDETPSSQEVQRRVRVLVWTVHFRRVHASSIRTAMLRRGTRSVNRSSRDLENKEEKKRFDRGRTQKDYVAGEKVLLYVPTRKIGRSEKLLLQFRGPYEVVKRIFINNYEIQDERIRKKMLVPVERLKKFHVRERNQLF